MKPLYHNKNLAVLCAITSILLTSPAQAQDWTQWRGSGRDGRATSFTAPADWKPKLLKAWSLEVGEGHSSPLIVNNKVYIQAREGEEEVVRALRLSDGGEIWKDKYSAPYEMNPAARGHGKGPKSTPVYANGMLYTFSINGVLTGYNAESGKVVWRKEFSKQFKTTAPDFGVAMSPIVDRDVVIAHVGGNDDGALTAFEARTGKVRWRWNGDGPSYASPVITFIGGVKQVITQTQHHCVGISATSGAVLWQEIFNTPYEQNSVSPIVIGDTVIFGGIGQPTFAVRVRKEGTAWKLDKLWSSRDAILYMNTPVVSGSTLYGMSQKRQGQLFSMNPITGAVLWTDSGRFGENAAILVGGGHLFALSNTGNLYIYKKNGTNLQKIFQQQVADTETWATPAISTRKMLIKDAKNLTLWNISQE